MNFWFWFWLFWLAFVSCSDTNTRVRRRGFQCEKLRAECKEMELRIRTMAKEQLGLNSLESLNQLEIEGWPRFVSIRLTSWDELALKYLNAALSAMIFKIKSAETSSGMDTDANRMELFAMLLKKFNATGRNELQECFKYIPWCRYHVRGWPRGVSLTGKAWIFADMLAIYHNIEEITWEPIRRGDECRRITYDDGTIELIPLKEMARGKRQRDERADESAQNDVKETRMNTESTVDTIGFGSVVIDQSLMICDNQADDMRLIDEYYGGIEF